MVTPRYVDVRLPANNPAIPPRHRLSAATIVQNSSSNRSMNMTLLRSASDPAARVHEFILRGAPCRRIGEITDIRRASQSLPAQ